MIAFRQYKFELKKSFEVMKRSAPSLGKSDEEGLAHAAQVFGKEIEHLTPIGGSEAKSHY
jgi:hypothetical protein